MYSNAILNLIKRSYENAIDIEVREVFIPVSGWVEPTSKNASLDDMAYLETIDTKMVNFKVTNEDGSFHYPDYNIKSVVNPKKYI
jgi:hypothetical protein